MIFYSVAFSIFIRKKHFCGVVAEAFESKSNVLYVRFFATRAGINSDFSLLYTAFTKKKAVDGKNTTLSCGQGEFDCDDDTCIDLDLVCDGQANCKFKKDEATCNVCTECCFHHFILFVVLCVRHRTNQHFLVFDFVIIQ